MATMMKYQYHLIGRSDDIIHFKMTDIEAHPLFSQFALKTKVRWSKNVMDERKCPDQIFLGAMDPDFCILLALAIYLEEWLSGNGKDCEYLFINEVISNPTPTILKGILQNQKTKYATRTKKLIFNNPEFQATLGASNCKDLGTHSFRKFAADYAEKCGMTYEEVETSGRWKKAAAQRVVGRYINQEHPYADAKVEGCLCVGGPIKYVLTKGNIAITREWLQENVVPSIFSYFGPTKEISNVLSFALLWACFDVEAREHVPVTILEKVTTAYELVRTIDKTINPVTKLQLSIYKVKTKLFIEESPNNSNNNNENTITSIQHHQNVVTEDHINGLLIQLRHTQQQIKAASISFVTSTNAIKEHFDKSLKTINRNINRIAIQPPQMASATQRKQNQDRQDFEEVQLLAVLCKKTGTLFQLYTEYEFGVDGHKAAKDFTIKERGKDRQNYYRRKVVWDAIASLIRRNYSVASAIDLIHQCYGKNTSITK
jgi:hypothetical protein